MPRPALRTAVAAALATLLTLAGGVGAASAAPTRVDVTVAETLPLTTGTVASGEIPGCESPVVTTPDVQSREVGPFTVFSGSKTFTCADDSTIDLVFRVRVRGCEATNRGWFRVIGGTGAFDGAVGFGRLVGTYTGVNSCEPTEVLDRYRGLIVVR